MLRNYFKIALRRVAREKGYSLINVVGLAIGMTCCLLIVLFVREELSYDRFHEKGDRIVRLVREGSALSAAPMGPALAQDLPEVDAYIRLLKMDGVTVRRGDAETFRESFIATDSTLFEIFSFELIHGDPDRALRRPDEILISRTAARRYFGDENPIGRTLEILTEEPVTMTVAGVVEDAPSTSHFTFDILASFTAVEATSNRIDNWKTNWLYTYLLLDENAKAQAVEAKLPSFFERRVGEEWGLFSIQKLHDIHLQSSHLGYDIAPQGDIRQVLLFSIIAALVLLIACINFVNLATARGMRRAKEVGVRKVVGAQRRQIVWQFLGESLVTALAAVGLASVLATLLLPSFRSFIGRELQIAGEGGFLIVALVAFVLTAGLVAGSYPAFYLSGFRPSRTLSGRLSETVSGGTVRKLLVVVQFAVSIFLIVGTIAIHQQLDYVQNARLGIQPEQTVVLPIGDEYVGQYEVLRNEMESVPGVQTVSAAGTVPAKPVSDFLYRPEGWTSEELRGWDTFFIDERYAGVLQLEVVAGRNFDNEIASDSSGFLLNESAWQAIRGDVGESWANPIGKQLEFYVPGSTGWEMLRSGPVVGIVEDFHYASMHAPIGPVVLMQFPDAYDYLLVRVDGQQLPATLEALEARWKEVVGSSTFDYYFLDESFDALYRAERRMGRLAGIFAGLALLVACLGLFGLATFMAERRTKEIGVRKVLGASVSSIVRLLSADFVKLVVIAFVAAAPVSYFVVNDWLDNFAYRIDIGPLLFAIAGVAAVMIALVSVGYQAIRAATRDPVLSLRYE